MKECRQNLLKGKTLVRTKGRKKKEIPGKRLKRGGRNGEAAGNRKVLNFEEKGRSTLFAPFLLSLPD